MTPAKDPVMRPTGASVDSFLRTLSARRRAEALDLIAMMREITGEEPALWGPSIIGFGSVHYRYASGREGDMGAAGFSPRKAALTIYIPEGFHDYGELLDVLGPHRISTSCLYITNLATIDRGILAELVTRSYRHQLSAWEEAGNEGGADAPTRARASAAARGPAESKPRTVEEYIARVPEAARSLFDELRALVRAEAPNAAEVLSYGIVGYTPDPKKGARVFISGWKDHVALYPVPREPEWAAELAPYQRGKGTLWFPLDRPLPAELIRRLVQELIIG